MGSVDFIISGKFPKDGKVITDKYYPATELNLQLEGIYTVEPGRGFTIIAKADGVPSGWEARLTILDKNPPYPREPIRTDTGTSTGNQLLLYSGKPIFATIDSKGKTRYAVRVAWGSEFFEKTFIVYDHLLTGEIPDKVPPGTEKAEEIPEVFEGRETYQQDDVLNPLDIIGDLERKVRDTYGDEKAREIFQSEFWQKMTTKGAGLLDWLTGKQKDYQDLADQIDKETLGFTREEASDWMKEKVGMLEEKRKEIEKDMREGHEAFLSDMKEMLKGVTGPDAAIWGNISSVLEDMIKPHIPKLIGIGVIAAGILLLIIIGPRVIVHAGSAVVKGLIGSRKRK